MSLEREETLKCPKCKTENKFHIYDSINVTLNPELKKKVLERFPVQNEMCGVRNGNRHQLRYALS